MRKLSLIFFILINIFLNQLFASEEKIRIAVTFIDFHSDGSCPDFNPGNDNEGVILNIASSGLDSDGLPGTGSKVFFSSFIKNWFRPFTEHKNKNQRPVYNPLGSLDKIVTVAYDTSYINKVIHDSIEFVLIDSNKELYQFLDSTFFPIDNEGFGKEPTLSWNGNDILTNHNYSFTMNWEKEFKYVAGSNMKFEFNGDDDVWVYIKDELALDLGGIHESVDGSFNLDDLGLEDQKRYTINFFFSERQADGSFIKIIAGGFIGANSKPIIVDTIPDMVVVKGQNDTLVANLNDYFKDDGLLDFEVTIVKDIICESEIKNDGKFYLKDFKKVDTTKVIVKATEINGEGLSVSDTFQLIITWEDVNPEVINPIPDLVIVKGSSDTLVAMLSNVFKGVGSLSFKAEFDGEELFKIKIDNTDELHLDVFEKVGVTNVIVEAINTAGSSSLDTFQVKVIEPNKNPIVVNPIPDVFVLVNHSDTVVIDFDDVFEDDGKLSFINESLDSSLVISKLNSDNNLIYSFKKDQTGYTYVFGTAIDEDNLSVSDTALVVVFPKMVIDTIIDTIIVDTIITDTVVIAVIDSIIINIITIDTTVIDVKETVVFDVTSLDSSIVIGLLDSNNNLKFVYPGGIGKTDIIVTATKYVNGVFFEEISYTIQVVVDPIDNSREVHMNYYYGQFLRDINFRTKK